MKLLDIGMIARCRQNFGDHAPLFGHAQAFFEASLFNPVGHGQTLANRQQKARRSSRRSLVYIAISRGDATICCTGSSDYKARQPVGPPVVIRKIRFKVADDLSMLLFAHLCPDRCTAHCLHWALASQQLPIDRRGFTCPDARFPDQCAWPDHGVGGHNWAQPSDNRGAGPSVRDIVRGSYYTPCADAA